MKKLIIPILCILLLCGCENKPQEYMITAIGVDYDKGLYTVSFEALIINTENEEQELKVITGKERTLLKAVEEIKKQNTLPLMLSHCGVVAVGDGISREKLKGIMRFAKEQGDITLSVQFLKTENANELLSGEPISSASVGYDLMSMMKTANEVDDKSLKNRLFEICESESPSLPKIEKNEKGYYFAEY